MSHPPQDRKSLILRALGSPEELERVREQMKHDANFLAELEDLVAAKDLADEALRVREEALSAPDSDRAASIRLARQVLEAQLDSASPARRGRERRWLAAAAALLALLIGAWLLGGREPEDSRTLLGTDDQVLAIRPEWDGDGAPIQWTLTDGEGETLELEIADYFLLSIFDDSGNPLVEDLAVMESRWSPTIDLPERFRVRVGLASSPVSTSTWIERGESGDR